MFKKNKVNPFDFNLKEGITSDELSKIQIFQNHALISLISYQTESTIQTVFNQTVWDEYKKNISQFINPVRAKPESNKILQNPDKLKPEFRAQYDNIKRRLDAGEDVSKLIEDLGFEDYFE